MTVGTLGTLLSISAGTYALFFLSSRNARIRVGRLGEMRLRPGSYIYVGSALGPGGVRARVSHHLQISPRPHWHVDYLKPHASIEEVWLTYSRRRWEHLWARLLSSMPSVSVPMPGFGSSDCGCEAHLFFFKSHAMRKGILDALSRSEASTWFP